VAVWMDVVLGVLLAIGIIGLSRFYRAGHILTIRNDFVNLSSFPRRPPERVGSPGSERAMATESALLPALMRAKTDGAGRHSVSMARGKAGRQTWHTDESGRGARYNQYAGHTPTCDRVRRAGGREATPSGQSPTSSAICLQHSRCFPGIQGYDAHVTLIPCRRTS
jgi:hypothetical protein